MTMHRTTAFLIEQDVGHGLVPLDPGAMSDSAILARSAEVQGIADDIRDQLLADGLAVNERGREWRGRAHRARKFYLAEVRMLRAEMDRRREAATKEAKLAIADVHAKAQQTQQALFVHLEHLTRERCAVTARRAVHILDHVSPAHPDAELLALCAQLSAMQDEWQRLWVATSDEWIGMDQDPITEADRAWWDYNNNVWPGVYISTSDHSQLDPNDAVRHLFDIHPVTPEGLSAKAAAVLAVDEAASYGDLRNDGYELNLSLIRDVAGLARRPLGEDATA
jgi:hypothetical protein